MEPDELERVIFFERARDEAEQTCETNPRDASALTRWGGALLELAHFRQGHDAYDMIDLARDLSFLSNHSFNLLLLH